MARDYGKKCSGSTAVKRMADGGAVNEWWGQGSDGGASPVAGVRVPSPAAAPAPTASPEPVKSLAAEAIEHVDNDAGYRSTASDPAESSSRAMPAAAPKPKAAPRPRPKAASAAGKNYSHEGRNATPQASYSNEGRRPAPPAQTPAQRVMQELRAIGKGANSKITYQPADNTPSIYRGLGMADGGSVGGAKNYGKK